MEQIIEEKKSGEAIGLVFSSSEMQYLSKGYWGKSQEVKEE